MSELMKLLSKQAQDFDVVFQQNKLNPSFVCRFHPTDGFHETGCPHREWSNKELYDALITAKASHEAYVQTNLSRPDPLSELRREVEECLERKKLGTLEMFRKNDIVFKRDLTKVKDRSDEVAWWEKVAFSLYSEIAEIDSSIRNVFENAADKAGEEPKPNPLEEMCKEILELGEETFIGNNVHGKCSECNSEIRLRDIDIPVKTLWVFKDILSILYKHREKI